MCIIPCSLKGLRLHQPIAPNPLQPLRAQMVCIETKLVMPQYLLALFALIMNFVAIVCPVSNTHTQPCAPPFKSHTPEFRNLPCALPPEASASSTDIPSAINTSTSSSNSVGAALNKELGEAYNAIEDLFNTTFSEMNASEENTTETNYDYVVTEASRTAVVKLPGQVEEDNPPAIQAGARRERISPSKDSVAEERPIISPKTSSPICSRAKSKSVFISDRPLPPPYETRGRSSSSGDLGSSVKKHGESDANRVLNIEELTENYATLEQQVRELKEELRMTRETQGMDKNNECLEVVLLF